VPEPDDPEPPTIDRAPTARRAWRNRDMNIRIMGRALLPAAVIALLTPPAAAQQHHSHGQPNIGGPAAAAAASRTVEVTVGELYFEPEAIAVRPGETIRFVVRNTGGLLHEFGIATDAMHAERRDAVAMMVDHGMLTATGIDHGRMKMDHSTMSGMAHGSMAAETPNTVLVEPGATAELVWTFPKAGPKAGVVGFACSMPGHYDAGMAGRFEWQQ
jgi:uncharacterized cupredoxin-like copper-binding protein